MEILNQKSAIADHSYVTYPDKIFRRRWFFDPASISLLVDRRSGSAILEASTYQRSQDGEAQQVLPVLPSTGAQRSWRSIRANRSSRDLFVEPVPLLWIRRTTCLCMPSPLRLCTKFQHGSPFPAAGNCSRTTGASMARNAGSQPPHTARPDTRTHPATWP